MYFLFVVITDPAVWNRYTVEKLRTELAARNLSQNGLKATLINRLQANITAGGPGILEISGSTFAITDRRFITCHHNIFDQHRNMNITTVAICTAIIKTGSSITPHPAHPVMYGDLHIFDAQLDYAIFNLQPAFPNLTPIPVCPVPSLPTAGFPSLTCYYGAVGDFIVAELRNLAIWRAGPYSILQYGETSATDPPDCKLLTEYGLCRGSSGGAMVTNGYVVAMHLASCNQGRYIFKHVKGSSLTTEQMSASLTDMQEIYSALKEGLVLCRIPQIMDAIANP